MSEEYKPFRTEDIVELSESTISWIDNVHGQAAEYWVVCRLSTAVQEGVWNMELYPEVGFFVYFKCIPYWLWE